MEAVFQPPAVCVKPSKVAGYGVFAAKDFKPGDVIEVSHALLLSTTPAELSDYIFNNYFDSENPYALALGCGSIYNHAAQPNADYYFERDTDSSYGLMRIVAGTFIEKGEEIFLNYGNTWFSDRNMKIVPPSGEAPFGLRKLISLLFRFGLIALFALFAISLIKHA